MKKLNGAIKEYFSGLGKSGGKAKSKAKARAVRKNLALARAKRWPKAAPNFGPRPNPSGLKRKAAA